MVQPLWKTVRKFLKKLKTELSYDPAIPFLSIYPKIMKTLISKDIYTPVFITALFIVAMRWKQDKHTRTDTHTHVH